MGVLGVEGLDGLVEGPGRAGQLRGRVGERVRGAREGHGGAGLEPDGGAVVPAPGRDGVVERGVERDGVGLEAALLDVAAVGVGAGPVAQAEAVGRGLGLGVPAVFKVA